MAGGTIKTSFGIWMGLIGPHRLTARQTTFFNGRRPMRQWRAFSFVFPVTWRPFPSSSVTRVSQPFMLVRCGPAMQFLFIYYYFLKSSYYYFYLFENGLFHLISVEKVNFFFLIIIFSPNFFHWHDKDNFIYCFFKKFDGKIINDPFSKYFFPLY